MPATIATIGECLIDFTPIERHGVTTGFDLHPGGAPLNVAVAVARLGHPAAFAARVSTDFFGERIVAHLVEHGVGLGLVSRGGEPTTLAFVAYAAGDADYSFRSENAADTLLTADDLDLARFEALAALHFGSISLLHPTTASSVLGLARGLKGRVTLTFDPNVRPSLVGDWVIYGVVVRECLRLADLVRLSEQDMVAWCDGTGEDLLELAVAAGPTIVTRAAGGSDLYAGGATLHVPAPPVAVADTVGAGDAYMAGLLVALHESGALDAVRRAAPDAARWRPAMELATAVAALTCERRGANPPTRAEVERSLRAEVPA